MSVDVVNSIWFFSVVCRNTVLWCVTLCYTVLLCVVVCDSRFFRVYVESALSRCGVCSLEFCG